MTNLKGIGMSTRMDRKKVESVFLFALSTCGMCRRVKNLLADLGIEYDYIDVDLLAGIERENAKQAMRKWDTRGRFPMLIINNSKCIIGDEPDLIKEALGR
jgi:glutaredoxin-like protein NrdH